MGEIAEMMMEGVLCECCGEFIGEPVYFPRRCSFCKKEKQAQDAQGKKTKRKNPKAGKK